MKIAIFATHPIQYQVPWFVALSRTPGIRVKVYFSRLLNDHEQGAGFRMPFTWDIPMYEGYEWQVLESESRRTENNGFFSSRVNKVVDVLERDRPDIVLLTGWQAASLICALWACVRLRLPRLVRGESSGLKPRPLPIRLIHRLLLAQFDGFLVIGEANRKFYSNYGISDSKLFSCPYFVDNARISEQALKHRAERRFLRDRWGIPDDSVCYLYVGKLIHKKRVMDQLAALKSALEIKPNLHLLVAGSGHLMEQARNFTQRNHLPVTFAGFLNQTEITAAYAAADCLVISSDYDETWGLVANEAMICGLPAIVSDRAGCSRDLIEPGETGRIFQFGDIDALSELMCSMAHDRAALVDMGRNARDLVTRQYSLESSVAGTLKAAESLLARESTLHIG